MAAVCEVVFGKGKTLSEVAETYGCDRRSVGRWLCWTADLAEVDGFVRATARLGAADAPPLRVPGGAGVGPRAGAVLAILERFVDVLRQRGVGLPAVTPGLMALLVHERHRFGTVHLLTRQSPPMHVSLEVLPV